MIVTEHYAVCDVCSERTGPFENERAAIEEMNSWYRVSKGVIVVQCHTVGCAKIALDDADELFKNSSPIGCFPPDSEFLKGVIGPINKNVGIGTAGTYMERMAALKNSQSGKHGEKEK